MIKKGSSFHPRNDRTIPADASCAFRTGWIEYSVTIAKYPRFLLSICSPCAVQNRAQFKPMMQTGMDWLLERDVRRLITLILLGCLWLSLVPGGPLTAEAGPGKKARKGPQTSEQGAVISRDRAAAIARAATGGRVLDIRLKSGKRPKYSVKMLLDGKRVRKVGVDARTGAILK